MANKSGIDIKKENKGKFTAKAKAHHEGTQEFAKQVKAHPENYSAKTVHQAVFARNAKTKFKHQAGGGVDVQYAPANPDIPMLQNPGNMPMPVTDPNQGMFTFNGRYMPRNRPDDLYLNTANEAIAGVTAIGNAVQSSKLRRQENMQLIKSGNQAYMQNMEGEGLDKGLPYHQYGGVTIEDIGQNPPFGRVDTSRGSMHGEGDTYYITDKSVGPNFKQYSKGIPSDTATNRREEDVPVAIKSGVMPKRYMVGGNANRQAPYLEYGGWDQVGFMMQAGGMPDVMMDPGYCMYGGVGFGVPTDYSNMTNEDYGYSGIAHNGPYGQKSVYKNGGEVSSAKAKEILRDGTVHGHPLTAAQKRYFGWKAGGSKAQTGGQPDPGVEYGPGRITTNNPANIQIAAHYKPYINPSGVVYSQDRQRVIGQLSPGEFNPNVVGANLNPEDRAFLNYLTVNPQGNPTIKSWNDATYSAGRLKVGSLLERQDQGLRPDSMTQQTSAEQFPQVAANAQKSAQRGTYKYGGRKYQLGGVNMVDDEGVSYAVGDELEMSSAMIKNLIKQGYKVEHVK